MKPFLMFTCLLLPAIFCFTCFFALGCNQRPATEDFPSHFNVLRVKGMDCSGCESFLEQEVFKVPKVYSVYADCDSGKLAYTGEATFLEVKAAVEAKGHHHPGQYKVIGFSAGWNVYPKVPAPLPQREN